MRRRRLIGPDGRSTGTFQGDPRLRSPRAPRPQAAQASAGPESPRHAILTSHVAHGSSGPGGEVCVTAHRFQVLDPSDPEEFRLWASLWSNTSHREVQAHPSYGMAFSGRSERFLGAVASTEGGTVILPFSVREVPGASAGPVLDAVTPYGYGGAYLDGRVDARWFWDCFDRWAQEARIVGITVRRHLFDDEILPVPGITVCPLQNVVVDLGQSMDQIWSGYEGRVRTDIRRGTELGVQVTVDANCAELESFHGLYLATMEAKGADPFYHFDLSRFDTLVRSLGSGVALFHAFHRGELVASEAQLIGARNAYYFLSGSSEHGRKVRANAVMKHAVIDWLRQRGIRHYILGGGRRADDSLFRYKRAYSPRDIRGFRVSFHESIQGAADDLVRMRMHDEPGWIPSEGFVPQYRAPGAGMGDRSK